MAVTGERKGIGGSSIPYMIIWDGTGTTPGESHKRVYGNPIQASITGERKAIDGASLPYIIAIDEQGNEIG
ncbi:hypothetical protein [Brucella sp. IR073]|uniref:hypothetical protein n=1 Tax=unclassified Brucella TaxID=2632610 RepID=UPI003B98432B